MGKKKTSGKKVVVFDEDKKPTKKDIEESENKMLFWVFVVVGVIFAGILISYFWVEGSKSFGFGGIDWRVEDYEYLRIYHGRFVSFANPDLFYNVYLRVDPRENNVATTGTFDSFKYGGVIALSPEVDACRGELSRGIFDLSAFLRQGASVGPVESASSDRFVAVESDRRFGSCDTILDRTLVIVDISPRDDSGDPGEPRVLQDEKNLYCYTIYAKDCEDISGIEKFIVKSVVDFRLKE
jgi:hypothetical protein